MIYLTKDDLISASFERFIDESSNDNEAVIDIVEAQNIELVKSYLGTRYNVALIFNAESPVLNPILKRILIKLVLFDVIRRNAARKVPTDIKDEYDKAVVDLEKISTGRLKIDGIPLAVDDNGNVVSNSLWGNNSNKNFYI